MFDCAILYKTMDNMHLHMFDCAILYKTMDNMHLHMFDCAILYILSTILQNECLLLRCKTVLFMSKSTNMVAGADPGFQVRGGANRDFSHEIPQQFSCLPPLGAIFLCATPLT
jgi:hypothetical protein